MKTKKILALLLATLMITTMAMSAVFAADGTSGGSTGSGTSTHTITITNTDQNVSHTYEAYQIFAGNLNADASGSAGQGSKLSNIVWGNGVNGPELLAALKSSEDPALIVKVPKLDASGTPIEGEMIEQNAFLNCTTAAHVADVLSTFTSTGAWEKDGSARADGGVNDNAGAIDAFATIVAEHLATKAADFHEGTGSGTGTYTAEVNGDGYYFIKDVTTTLTASGSTASDTKSKYILAVVRDTTVVAKDTGITPDKKITSGTQRLAADSKAIGDEVQFEVKVVVPNTKKYEDHFIFIMNDQLPTGMTFKGLDNITINGTALPADNYTLTVKDGGADYGDYNVNSGTDLVAKAGGQAIKIVFNDFKKYVEANNLIGKDILITYTAVVNDDATFTKTENENEVSFQYSNDPNHDYTGDEPSGTEPLGETPKSKTRTYTTSFQIKKVDENGIPLANAIFELTGTALNRTVLTGVKYEKQPYTAKIDEVVDSTDYWLLKDGSYTTTEPNGENVNQSMYATPLTDKYVKVTYTTDEIATKQTTLTVASDSNGVIKFTGLTEGTYTLKEIAAPDGFNKIDGTSTITITWEDPELETTSEDAKKQGGFTITATDFAEGISFSESTTYWESGTSGFIVTIENKSGTELPSTGGIGTTIFYIVGGLLAVGAGVLLVTKRRMGKEDI